MRRRVFVPTADRFVTVETGTVRDLDGNTLGYVDRGRSGYWVYRPFDSAPNQHAMTSRADALVALLSDPSCPTPGPNRYDR